MLTISAAWRIAIGAFADMFNRRRAMTGESVIQPRHMHAALQRALHCLIIPRIHMPENTHSRIARQYHLQTALGISAAVSHDNHAGMEAVADAHPTTVMNTHPPS